MFYKCKMNNCIQLKENAHDYDDTLRVFINYLVYENINFYHVVVDENPKENDSRSRSGSS